MLKYLTIIILLLSLCGCVTCKEKLYDVIYNLEINTGMVLELHYNSIFNPDMPHKYYKIQRITPEEYIKSY